MVAAAETRVIAALKHAQANSIALYLNAKRCHWFTYGPLFRDLHLFFDELASDAITEIDQLAERLRMLGGEPISTPREIESWATVAVADGKPGPRVMLEQSLANERKVVAELRDAARLADDELDPGTNDLLTTLVQVHEKHAWFIGELLRRDDGLVT